MSTLQFPANPVVGDTYDWDAYKYVWDGEKWKTVGIGYNPVNDLKEAITELGGELDPTAKWSAVPAHSDAEIGGPMDAQAEALAARTKMLRTEVMEALRRSYAEAGYDLIGRFRNIGLVVNTAVDAVLWEPTGVAYSYSGTLPHTIGAGETPIGNPLWVPRDSSSLRQELSTESGAGLSLSQVATAYGLKFSDGGVWTPGEALPLTAWRYYNSKVWKANAAGAVCGATPAFASFRYIESDGSITPFGTGAVGDGVANDHPAIARWLASPEKVKNCYYGKFIISALTLSSDVIITLSPLVEFIDAGLLAQLEPNIMVKDVQNVIIKANFAKIGQYGKYTAGEWRHGLMISKSAKNIRVSDFIINDCAGDGVYVGTYAADDAFPPKDIFLTNIMAKKNRRQGMSVTNVDGLTVDGGSYSETGDGLSGNTFPMAGIDFEPNSNIAVLKRITVNNVAVEPTPQKGIEFNLSKLDATSEPVDIVINHVTLKDVGFGIKLGDCPAGVRGKITFNDPVCKKANWSFAAVGAWSAAGVKVFINNPQLTEINNSNSSSSAYGFYSCVKFWHKYGYDVGGISMTNVKMTDSPNVKYIFGYALESTGKVANNSLLGQDMTLIEGTPDVISLRSIPVSDIGVPSLTTQFTRLAEAVASADQNSLAGKECGRLITNRGVVGGTVTRISSSLNNSVHGPKLQFFNVTGERMEVLIDSGIAGTFRPSNYTSVSTKKLISAAIGDYLEIYSDGDNNWYISKIIGLWNGV